MYRYDEPDSEEEIELDELGYQIKSKDELGYANKDLIKIATLHGVIQRDQKMEYLDKGSESEPQYVGYFIPEFDIDTSKLNEYRVKYDKSYETLIMKIVEYNPNLYLRGKQHHIKLKLMLEKKYNTVEE